ncbi:MAG: hypothetical protein WDO71_28485 [Bacteroidota bacterium]
MNPEKGIEEQTPIKGTAIEKSGKMYKMLQDIFYEAPNECKFDIAFQPNEKGEQKNECRDLIIKYTKSGRFQTGKLIASRLQNITTKRSGLGLFFLILGNKGGTRRLVISRFPADNGILAEEIKATLSVQFVERIFMKSAKAYKSACYEGSSYDGEFWAGKAIDKQIESDLTISDYWIKEFLLSDFATAGGRGTRRLATAFRDAINKSKSIEVKEDITSALKLAKNFNGKVLSPASFAQRLGLSNESQNALKAEMNETLFNEQFTLLTEELNKLIAFKTIELDNGAYLSAETKTFDSVFQRTQAKKGETTFSTTGKIADERVRKQK